MCPKTNLDIYHEIFFEDNLLQNGWSQQIALKWLDRHMWKMNLNVSLILSKLTKLAHTGSTCMLSHFSSAQFSRSIVSDSLRPHELQHTRPPCPSPAPRVYSNSCPLVGDAIQPSHPLLSPSPPAPNPSKHQCLFQWVNSSHEVAKVLEFQLQHQSFQWTPRTDLL